MGAELDDPAIEAAARAHYDSLEWGGCAGGGWDRLPEGPRADRLSAMAAALRAGLQVIVDDLAPEPPHFDDEYQWGRVEGVAEEKRICRHCGKIQILVGGVWTDEGPAAAARFEMLRARAAQSITPACNVYLAPDPYTGAQLHKPVCVDHGELMGGWSIQPAAEHFVLEHLGATS